MYTSSPATYNCYGAFALKARYQHNMLISQLLVIGCFGIAVTTAALWPKEKLIEIGSFDPPRIRDSIVIIITEPPSVRPISTPPGSQPPPKDNSGVIPEPVGDTLRSENTIPTGDTPDNSIGADTGSGGDGITIDTSSNTDYLRGPGVFQILEIPPELVNDVEPEYPRFARLAQIEGTVTLWGLVSEEGDIIETQVAKSSGYELLDEAAVTALMQSKWKPGIQNGRAVKCWISQRFKFELE